MEQQKKVTEELGECTYCMRTGRAKNVRVLPEPFDESEVGINIVLGVFPRY